MYVWAAYGFTALLMALEIAAVCRCRRATRRQAERSAMPLEARV